jgi:hypothetical protein
MTDQLVYWYKNYARRVVRRKNGDMRYIVVGIGSAGQKDLIYLRRVGGASYTWAPASDIEKFILVSPDECVSGAASIDALTSVVERCCENAEASDLQKESFLELKRRNIAIKALEIAAEEGDVPAAIGLLDLT